MLDRGPLRRCLLLRLGAGLAGVLGGLLQVCRLLAGLLGHHGGGLLACVASAVAASWPAPPP